MNTDDPLFDAVGAVLGARGGWHYEPSSSPGGPPSWCLDPGGEVVVAVTVLDGVVSAYLPATDRDVAFADTGALVAWLDEREGRTAT